jgi:7-cyano-7-deazaguanine synthase
MTATRKAVILSSGGVDSTTVMAMAKAEGYEIYSLSFRYGQRHVLELEAAERIARRFGAVRHLVMTIDMRLIGGSALTAEIEVPKNRSDEALQAGIPVTYVPARNTIFLSYALAWAEVLEAADIFIGVNAIDYSGYPDCRPAFVTAFEALANLAVKAAVEGRMTMRIRAPLLSMTKAQLIRTGLSLGVDYAETHSSMTLPRRAWLRTLRQLPPAEKGIS